MGPVMSPEDAVSELAAATAHLVRSIKGLPDIAVGEPSLLPGWTRGHVLAHLARNAEAGTRLLSWARTGVPSYEYESLAARAGAIEAGAGRRAADLVDDVRRTAEEFAAAAEDMPKDGWQRMVRYTAGPERRAEVIVPSRLTEVLLHHVDLDLAYKPLDWPRWFTRERLMSTTASLTSRGLVSTPVRLRATDTNHVFCLGFDAAAAPVVAGPECELLAWLFGRSNGGRLHREPPGLLPAIPPIY